MPLRRGKRLALAGILLLAGCSSVPGFVASSLGLPVDQKVLMSKRGPGELIAVDGTSCFVSTGRFESAEVGEHVTCFWSGERRRDPGT